MLLRILSKSTALVYGLFFKWMKLRADPAYWIKRTGLARIEGYMHLVGFPELGIHSCGSPGQALWYFGVIGFPLSP